ncbi:MAG: hypothetical protein JXA77_06455 [Bacteroidales bacterium]|nr:hypothetical protein [Bacteroidales bacterium]MBN2819477.1 hypothetical protein [Bacteroidales bacterium]
MSEKVSLTFNQVLILLFTVYISNNGYTLVGGKPASVTKLVNNIAEGDLGIDESGALNKTGILGSVIGMKRKLEDMTHNILSGSNLIVTAIEQLSKHGITAIEFSNTG